MKCIEKLREKDPFFREWKDEIIFMGYCPHRLKLNIEKPIWCVGNNTSRENCKYCWEREI